MYKILQTPLRVALFSLSMMIVLIQLKIYVMDEIKYNPSQLTLTNKSYPIGFI